MALHRPPADAEGQSQIQPFGGNQLALLSNVGASDPAACFPSPSSALQCFTQPFPQNQQTMTSFMNHFCPTIQMDLPSASFENSSQMQPPPQMISSGTGAFGPATQLGMSPFKGLNQSRFSLPVTGTSVCANEDYFVSQRNEASFPIVSYPGGFMVDNQIRGSVEQQSSSGHMARQFGMVVQQTYSENMDLDDVV
jgi:hypothetical protein